MDGRFYCGLPELMTTGDLKRDAAALWWLEGSLPSVDPATMHRTVQEAFDAWSDVCACAGERAQSPQQAHCMIRVANIDGRQGVLADCQLPGPPVQQMRLDGAEAWVVQIGADVAANVIDLFRVLVHELGHFWGLGHAPRNSPNLMAPTYARGIWLPQPSWDVAQIQALYGQPRPKPPTPGENRTPSVISIFDQAGAVLASYELGRRLA